MKLIIFLHVLMVLGKSFGSSETDTLIGQEQFRVEFKDYFNTLVGLDVDNVCTHVLSTQQTIFGNQKLVEFTSCGNATIDKFVDSLNFDAQLTDIENTKTFRRYIGPICDLFDDIFNCIRGVEPLIDLCISNREKRFKTRLFTIVPLLQQTVCLKNGSLLADLFEHDDGPRCIEQTFEWVTEIGFDDLFDDENVNEFFGSTELCSKFNNLRLDVYKKVAECSQSILDNIIKEVLGYFCEGTQCHRFIKNLECF